MKNPPLHRYATRPGLYFTDDGGADAVVRSETADQVWFCVLEPLDQPSAFYADATRLFNEPGLTFIDQAKKQRICTRRIPSLNLRETLFRMDGPNYGLWYVHVPQAWDGMQYGYRVNGPWDPDHGVSFNPYKLLLDPYAKGIEGSMKLDPGAFAYECEIVNGKVKGSPCRIWASPPSNCCRSKPNKRNSSCRNEDAPTTGDTPRSDISPPNPHMPPNARKRQARPQYGKKSSTWCAHCTRPALK